MVLVQTTVSVRAEQQDVIVTAVMKGSMAVSGLKIEYPKTDKAEIALVLAEIQPRRENGFSIGRNIVKVLSVSRSA
jgi:hypothetical protein